MQVMLQREKVPFLMNLREFFRIPVTGSIDSSKTSHSVDRVIESSASDVIYTVTRGEVKPAKHCLLALGTKSITGSKKMINILNHCGHCLGYHTTEEIETNLAITVDQKELTTPDRIILEQGRCTATCFDNYDDNKETLSGLGTLHDTVGIIYQNVHPDDFLQDERIQHPENEENPNGAILNKDAVNICNKKYCKVKEVLCFPSKGIGTVLEKKTKIKTFDYAKTQTLTPGNLQTVH